MSIVELTQLVRESSKTMSAQDRTKLLTRAKIITQKGHYNAHFFSEETVKKDRASKSR